MEEKVLRVREGVFGKFHVKLEDTGEYLASLGDIEQGEDVESILDVVSTSKIHANASCPGCTKVATAHVGGNEYKLKIKYDTKLLGRIIKKVWVTSREGEQIVINLRGFVKKKE